MYLSCNRLFRKVLTVLTQPLFILCRSVMILFNNVGNFQFLGDYVYTSDSNVKKKRKNDEYFWSPAQFECLQPGLKNRTAIFVRWTVCKRVSLTFGTLPRQIGINSDEGTKRVEEQRAQRLSSSLVCWRERKERKEEKGIAVATDLSRLLKWSSGLSLKWLTLAHPGVIVAPLLWRWNAQERERGITSQVFDKVTQKSRERRVNQPEGDNFESSGSEL